RKMLGLLLSIDALACVRQQRQRDAENLRCFRFGQILDEIAKIRNLVGLGEQHVNREAGTQLLRKLVQNGLKLARFCSQSFRAASLQEGIAIYRKDNRSGGRELRCNYCIYSNGRKLLKQLPASRRLGKHCA